MGRFRGSSRSPRSRHYRSSHLLSAQTQVCLQVFTYLNTHRTTQLRTHQLRCQQLHEYHSRKTSFSSSTSAYPYIKTCIININSSQQLPSTQTASTTTTTSIPSTSTRHTTTSSPTVSNICHRLYFYFALTRTMFSLPQTRTDFPLSRKPACCLHNKTLLIFLLTK